MCKGERQMFLFIIISDDCYFYYLLHNEAVRQGHVFPHTTRLSKQVGVGQTKRIFFQLIFLMYDFFSCQMEICHGKMNDNRATVHQQRL